MDADELQAWLRLTLTPGVGNVSARKLLAAFGLPQSVFEQPARLLSQVVSSAQAQALCEVPDELAALLVSTQAWLARDEPHGMRRVVATLGDPSYPQALLNLDDPPLMLYLLGRASFKPFVPLDHTQQAQGAIEDESVLHVDPQRSVAMVGSRNPTPQGAGNARAFAQALVQAGATVVSGLALGIDGAAHEGALAAAASPHLGATVAVVGTGLDRVYPRAHRDLAHRIAEHGLLVSEYPLGTPPLNANFPKRNRLIAGLAQGTLVVEAALKSGTLITARLTNEQGKEVFAVPGSIHAAQSRGCHALIKQGATLVESAQDVLDALNWASQPAKVSTLGAVSADTASAESLFDAEVEVLQAIGFDPVGLDALQARTGLDAPTLQAQLMLLELQGQVASLPGGLFQRQAS